jgi:UDP-N-acetylmuramoyl-tripeptide--D-alanyl-D-alanine ligase
VRFSVADLLAATDGHLLRGSPAALLERVSTDSRTLQAGDLFVALVGERFDGHDFLEQATAQGACGALISRGTVAAGPPILVRVSDTTRALGRLAAYVRSRVTAPIVGITGSNGKTTAKELTAAVLGEHVLKAEASFNNVIGVSRTLLELEPHHRAAVLEFGTNHVGEIAALVDIARPTVGVWLNVSAAHTEFLGDEEGVAREKSALVLGAEEAILNADDPRVMAYASKCRRVITFGGHEGADVRAVGIRMDAGGFPSFDVSFRGAEAGRVSLRALGAHNVPNALAAAAVGLTLGVPVEDIVARLRRASPPKMRMERLDIDGVVVYNDAYNANPASVRAAWRFLRDVPVRGRRWIVFGEMLELGVRAAEHHRAAASELTPAACDVLVATGRYSDEVAVAAKKAGVAAVIRCASAREAGEVLADLVAPGDAILLKASRGERFEDVLSAYRAAHEGTSVNP